MTRWERLLRWEEAHRFAVDATGTAVPAAAHGHDVDGHHDRGGRRARRSLASPLISFAVVAPLAWRRRAPDRLRGRRLLGRAAAQLAFARPARRPGRPRRPASPCTRSPCTDPGGRTAWRSSARSSARSCSASAMNGWFDGPGARVDRDLHRRHVALAVWASAWSGGRDGRRSTALVDRAERLEVERDQQSQIATAAERARIAREMHDIVAHSLSVMIAQADGGRYAARRRPRGGDPGARHHRRDRTGGARRHAAPARRAARRGSGAARRRPGPSAALGRARRAEPRARARDFAPQPAESGHRARWSSRSGRAGCGSRSCAWASRATCRPARVSRSYRICPGVADQRAQARRPGPHGHRPGAVVARRHRARGQRRRPGRRRRTPTALGQGLLGMRERAAMFGGTVSAGPRPGGGFRVRAQLPTPSDTAPASTARRCSPPTRGPRPVPSTPDEAHPMSDGTIRVALVDDQQLVRAGFRMVIDSQPDLEVVLEAGDGEQARARPRSRGADGHRSGRRRAHGRPHAHAWTGSPRPRGSPRGATDDAPAPRVIVLTTFDLDEYVLAAIRAGASGFLLKDAPPEEMLAAIRTVHRGDAVIAPSSTKRLLEHLVTALLPDEPRRPHRPRTPRRARRPHRPRARGARPHGARPVEHRDRRGPVRRRGDRQDARRPHPGQARASATGCRPSSLAYETGLVRPGAEVRGSVGDRESDPRDDGRPSPGPDVRADGHASVASRMSSPHPKEPSVDTTVFRPDRRGPAARAGRVTGRRERRGRSPRSTARALPRSARSTGSTSTSPPGRSRRSWGRRAPASRR